MVKRIAVVVLVLLGAWACASAPVAPPAFFVEDLPSDATTRLNLDDRIAAVYAWEALKANRTDRARKYLMKLGTANPVREAGLAYADLLDGNITAAEARFESSIEGTPTMVPSRVGLIQIYESRRERDKAFAEYREILKVDPGNRWAAPRFEALRDELVRDATAAARTALAAGNRETAKREFLRVLSYAPGSASAHLELARIYRQEKNKDEALAHYQAALAEGTADQALLREYGEFLAEAGELGLSLEVFEKLAAEEPRDAAVNRRVEEIKAKLGVYEIPSQYDEIPALETVGPALHHHGRLPGDHAGHGEPHLPAQADHQPGRAGRRGCPAHRSSPEPGGPLRPPGRDAADPDRRRDPGQRVLSVDRQGPRLPSHDADARPELRAGADGLWRRGHPGPRYHPWAGQVRTGKWPI
jgi:Tfp pilus assembly protein PilF